MKIKKLPLVRIAQIIVGTEIAAGGIRWPITTFSVEDRSSGGWGDEGKIEVRSPIEAREVAMALAKKIGGRIYRGQLPGAWHAALAEFPNN